MGYYMYLCIVKKGDTQHEQLQTRIIRRTHQTNHQKKDDTEIRTIKKGVQQKEEERPIIIFGEDWGGKGTYKTMLITTRKEMQCPLNHPHVILTPCQGK